MPCGEASVTRMQKFTWWHLITRSRPWMTRPWLTWSFFCACVCVDRCFFYRWLDMSCSELSDCWFYVRFCVRCERFWSLSVCLSALSRSVHLFLWWECVGCCVCFCERMCCVAKKLGACYLTHSRWNEIDRYQDVARSLNRILCTLYFHWLPFRMVYLFWRKGILNWSQVPVKTFIMLQISISNKCCSFVLLSTLIIRNVHDHVKTVVMSA